MKVYGRRLHSDDSIRKCRKDFSLYPFALSRSLYIAYFSNVSSYQRKVNFPKTYSNIVISGSNAQNRLSLRDDDAEWGEKREFNEQRSVYQRNSRYSTRQSRTMSGIACKLSSWQYAIHFTIIPFYPAISTIPST